jgi:hypothetical protein
MVDKIKSEVERTSNKPDEGVEGKYLYAIDELKVTDLKPLLKCKSPCYTCLDAVADYCLSCWGQYAGEDETGTRQANTNFFLQ